jgi:molecular chaperone GrpE
VDKNIETMALDIIQLIDAVQQYHQVYEKEMPNEDNYSKLLKIVDGIAQDLRDILYRQSIEPYNVTGDEVDVRKQKIVQTVDTDNESQNNKLAFRLSEGYEKNGKVIRPERIKIFKYNQNNKNIDS